MDQKVSVIVSKQEIKKDLRELPLPDQLTVIDKSIEDAVLGSISILLSNTHMAATYALPNALRRKVSCRVKPLPAKCWEINISPK